MNLDICLLIKVFEREEHADAFLRKGELFCRTLGEFKGIDDEDARGDRYEGVVRWHQPGKISLTIKFADKDGVERSIPVQDIAGPLVVQHTGYDRLNLYCMYAVKVPEFEETCDTEEERLRVVQKVNAMLRECCTLSEKILSLGEFAVVVYRVGDFIEKVRQAATDRGFSCWDQTVEYYDPDTFDGGFGELAAVFSKRKIYDYQQEYRFVFGSHEPEGTKTIHVGSLEGLAIKVPTREINEKIELKIG